MIEALEPHVAGIATLPPQEEAWRGKIPAVRLDEGPLTIGQRWRKWRKRFGRADERTVRIKALASAIKDLQIDAVFAHYVNFALEFQEVWNSTDVPLLVHAHGYDMQIGESLFHRPGEPRFGQDYWDSVTELSKRARFCLGSNNFARNFEKIGVPADRVTVKPYGVPVPDAPMARPRRDKQLTILYLGRLADFKGPDLVIRAFEIARDRGLDAKLIMAGDGDLMPTCRLLRHWSKHKESIELRGAVNWQEVDPLMKAADIFIAHSCVGPITRGAETFGVAFAEAMSLALPVATAAAGSIPELITSGHDGLLVEPGDIEGQVQHLLDLRDPDLRQQLGQQAWQTARDRFDCSIEKKILSRLLGVEPQ